MREWNLSSRDPLSLTLAADARLNDLDYTNDQIWELSFVRGDPASILLQTTYGLRARSMRLFPQFAEEHQVVANPADFDVPPIVTRFYPNYLRIAFAPFAGIDVEMEYWVSNCQVIAGRIQVRNNSVIDRQLRFELAALLSPSGEGQAMLPEKREVVSVLEGKTGGLSPVLFITGGAKGVSSPYPALTHALDLPPDGLRRFTWVLASLEYPADSFRLARQTATRNWEAELARIELTNAGQVEIYTGKPDWDAAFALGQKAAYSLLYSPTPALPFHSFVNARLPDLGFSRQGDGSDYAHMWNGQTALGAWYLVRQYLPGAPEIAAGLLHNFLSTQGDNGRVDWKPGLAGQRANMLAAPLLVDLTWRIYQHTGDKAFLQSVFRPLLEFIHAWFDFRQDRDGDGVPEWDSPTQTGFDDNPTFSRWHPWAQGAEITLIENPDLCAYLYHEIQLLINIAEEIDYQEPVSALQAFAGTLHSAVQASWDSRRATYQYWDRDTHQTRRGETIKKQKGPGELKLDVVFERPVRILLRLESGEDYPALIQAAVHGCLQDGKRNIEQLSSGRFIWINGVSTVTLPNLYTELEQVVVEGLSTDGKVEIRIVDHTIEDHTLLLPIWAGIPKPKQVEKIISRKLGIPSQYGKPHGVPAYRKTPKEPEAAICASVWLPWNVMIGEGLLAYGHREEAVDLVSRLMTGITATLKREHAFRRYYHAEQAQASGERDILFGLPPISLFLDTLGVRVLNPWKVFLYGINPFPWRVKIKYRGLTVDCELNATTIQFPDGQSITISEAAQYPCLVASDSLPITGSGEANQPK